MEADTKAIVHETQLPDLMTHLGQTHALMAEKGLPLPSRISSSCGSPRSTNAPTA